MRPNAPPLSTSSAHVTLLDIVSPLTRYSFEKRTIIETMWPNYARLIRQVLTTSRPSSVRLGRLRYQDGTLIVFASKIDELNTIRRNLYGSIKPTTGTKPPPEIAHITLARDLGYSGTFEIPLYEPIELHFSKFRIVHELSWPMVRYKTLATFRLEGAIMEDRPSSHA